MLCQLDRDLGNWTLPNFLLEIVPIVAVDQLGIPMNWLSYRLHYFVVVVCEESDSSSLLPSPAGTTCKP